MNGKDAELQAPKHSDFAHRLRELRRQKDLSQTELAERVQVHSTHISRYERGLSRPSADTLKRLADVLGVSGDYLLEGATDEAGKARFEDRELLRRFQEVQELPERDKEIIKELLDAFLTKKHLQKLAGQ
jgi:transcriptional regulator with XRE-family HTH domain